MTNEFQTQNLINQIQNPSAEHLALLQGIQENLNFLREYNKNRFATQE